MNRCLISTIECSGATAPRCRRLASPARASTRCSPEARGASANARATAQSKQTALHNAAWNGDQRLVEMLLAAGADLHARDEEHDSTPRGWAETSLEITRNPAAGLVAAYLASIGG